MKSQRKVEPMLQETPQINLFREARKMLKCLKQHGDQVLIVIKYPGGYELTIDNRQLSPASAPSALPISEKSLSEKKEPRDQQEEKNWRAVKSPLVGTFYASPNPQAPPFVQIGDTVRKGQVLCIVEAMKMMNEVEAEEEGIIREICVEDRQPVEYGEQLFLIEPLNASKNKKQV